MNTLSLAPSPRGYTGTALMLGSTTALPFALVLTWLLSVMIRRPFAELLPVGLVSGLLFGLVSGFTMALFLKSETVSLPCTDRVHFLSRLNVALAQLGYHPRSQSDRFYSFRPSFYAGLLAGSIAVQLNAEEAIVVGPKIFVQRVCRDLASN